MKNNNLNQRMQAPISQYNESPPGSLREEDITTLIEKKLGSIESYFQNVRQISEYPYE